VGENNCGKSTCDVEVLKVFKFNYSSEFTGCV